MRGVAPLRRVARLAAAFAGAMVFSSGLLHLPEGVDPATAQDAASTPASTGNPGQALATNVCIGCHSPPSGPALSGMLTGKWLSPNITPDAVSGVGVWSREDLFRYLRTGKAPGRGQAGGPMAAVIEALQGSSDADIYALVDWLLSQPAQRDAADTVPASERGKKLTTDPALVRGTPAQNRDPLDLGAILYNTACASCHGADGAGSPEGHFPSMFHNSSVGRRTPYNLVASLLDGVERHLKSGIVFMQSFDGQRGIIGGLSDEELAALSNFVVNRFGDPEAASIGPEDVESSRLVWWGAGDPSAARGQLIAVGGGPGGTGATCFGCHGLEGQGDAGSGSPRLAGLDVSYFAKQLRDYASGARPHGAMSPIAHELNEADHHSLALYYAGLPAQVSPAATADTALVQTGAVLYADGSAERGIQACADCHGAAGEGMNPVYPDLPQPAAYTDGQLRLWRDGIRRNDAHDLMADVARRMSDEDIRAVSAFIASLAP